MINVLEINFLGIKFKNPILLASGTVGYGHEIGEFINLNNIGGIVTKSISLLPRKGNKPTRVVETPAGMLNAIGLANVGVEEYIKEKLPFLAKYDTNVICNIAGSSIEEYVECVSLLTNENNVKAFEINISCPNVKEGGLIFGNNLESVANITYAVKKVSSKPIIIKLSPNVSNIASFAQVVKDNGGDAVSAINTLVGMAIDHKTKRPVLSNNTGGLSGPCIKPIALAKINEIRSKVDIPIIGIGGINGYIDVLEFMIAGSSLVQIGTANFTNPTIAEKIIQDLTDYSLQNNLSELSEIIGSIILN